VKQGQELADNAVVQMIREAEAVLFESQEALRAAMRDRIQTGPRASMPPYGPAAGRRPGDAPSAASYASFWPDDRCTGRTW
jgi:hypothetical protein